MTRKFYLFFLLLFALTAYTMSCKKSKTLSVGGNITFSVDTLKFDTVFTTQGSFTNGFLIYNPQDQDIILSSVRMGNYADTFFHLNVDGFSGNNVPNIKIRAHDSAYVFATVKINPNDSLTPFYITDSIVATLNGKNFYLPVTAYGQNAHFIVSDSIGTNTTWKTDLPYVVIHYALVGPGVTLTIPAKCKVYMHQDARIFVYGTLNVGDLPGTAFNVGDSVVFQGDRLDRAYFGYMGYPGEWGGLYFITGSQGYFNQAVIKNCGGSTNSYKNFQTLSAAIEVDSGANLTIKHSIVENSIGYGILDFQGSVNAIGCLIDQTGAEAFICLQGGNANLTNCTFANFGSTVVSHATNGTVTLVNFLPLGNGRFNYGNLNATLNNCVVWGSLDSELFCDTIANTLTNNASITLNHCLLKTGNYFQPFINFAGCIKNESPLFKDSANNDYHLTYPTSPGIGTGDPSFSPGVYLDGKNVVMPPDIGCY